MDRLLEAEELMWQNEVAHRHEADRNARALAAAQERERLLLIEHKKREEAHREAELLAEVKRRADEELQLQKRREAEAVATEAEAKRLADIKARRAVYEEQWRAPRTRTTAIR